MWKSWDSWQCKQVSAQRWTTSRKEGTTLRCGWLPARGAFRLSGMASGAGRGCLWGRSTWSSGGSLRKSEHTERQCWWSYECSQESQVTLPESFSLLLSDLNSVRNAFQQTGNSNAAWVFPISEVLRFQDSLLQTDIINPRTIFLKTETVGGRLLVGSESWNIDFRNRKYLHSVAISTSLYWH